MGQKSYDVNWVLRASKDGSYSKAFASAQAEIAAAQKQIQEFNRQQGDISSYQKAQASMEKYGSKLQNLKQQYAVLEREMKTTGNTSAANQTKLLKLQMRIDDTQRSLNRSTESYKRYETALKDASIDTNKLTEESARLSSQIEEQRQVQERAAESMDEDAGKIADGFTAMGEALLSAGIITGLKQIADGYKECINSAAELEAAMSVVEALSGADESEMQGLTTKAKSIGATTKFTAKEAGDAMGYMAMAGWDADDMVNGIDGVINLSAASGEDLALVSDIVTDSLTAFGLKAKDTEHFADVLAAAATNSNTSVSIMGETFKTSASIAGALGYSIEDVATAVGLMANSGVKGSIAGTALKNTFNGLLEGVTLIGAAFGEYEFNAIKADGTMKGFADTIDELRVVFAQMTEAERVNNAMELAGQRGYNGLLAILNATDDDYASLTESINNCSGAAERMAEIRMDNLTGDLTIMSSAWDALKTSIGEQFLPKARAVTQWGTELISQADEWVQKNPELIAGGTVTVGLLGSMAAGVTGLSAAIKLFKALNVAGVFGSMTGPIMAGAAAVALLAGGAVTLYEGLQANKQEIKELTAAAQAMSETFADAEAEYAASISTAEATADVANLYIDKLEEMGDYASLSGEKQDEYRSYLEMLCQTVPELSGLINTETGEIEGGTEALRENTKAWEENAIAQAKQKMLAAEYEAKFAAEVEYKKNENALDTVKEDAAELEEKLSELQQQAYVAQYKAQQMADEHYRSTGEEVDASDYYGATGYNDLEKQIAQARTERGKYNREIQTLETALKDAGAKLADAESDYTASKEAIDSLLDAGEAAVDALDMSAEAEDAARSTMDSYTRTITEYNSRVATAFLGVSNGVKGALVNAVGIGLQFAVGGAAGSVGIPGYASGTTNAAPGMAWVGENGPELMMMRGGETIIPNERLSVAYAPILTMAGSDGGKIEFNYSPTYHFEGNVGNVDDLRAVLAECKAEMKGHFMEWLNEAKADMARRAYVL